MRTTPPLKPIRWMRSSLVDLKAFPEDARSEIGQSLYLVQRGERPSNEKPLHGDLAGISELRADSNDGNTYRSVFTVTLDPYIFVLHCFEKKAKTGMATSKRHLDIIRKRLKEAREVHRDLRRTDHAEGD